MKTPRFEELARRWQGRAELVFVYSSEAHARADSSQPLNAFADRLQAMDADGDGVVTLAEYHGPRSMFDAFDLDHDGVVRAHELLAARRIDQFRDVDEPRTFDERMALARRFRAEVPGSIPVLVDAMDGRTATAYGELPNSAYVIAPDGKVAMKEAWASASDVERELAVLTGAPPPAAPPPPDLGVLAPSLARARASGQRVLVELTAPGCPACRKMEATTLIDPAVVAALGHVEVAPLSVEHDDAWRLFESLELSATPAFVLLDADGAVRARLEGAQDRDAFLAFLAR